MALPTVIGAMRSLGYRAGRTFAPGPLLLTLALVCAPAWSSPPKVEVTDLTFSTTVGGTMASVRDALTSALEGENYMIVNTLNVQEALRNRDIAAEPIQLVEFINLTKAYAVTRSDSRFELFAPLRAALFQREGNVVILILRPRFIEATLGSTRLSPEARQTLEGFDDSLKQVLETVATGGF